MAVLASRNVLEAIQGYEVKLAESAIANHAQVNSETRILYVNLDVKSAYIVPKGADNLRVIAGGAWVSYHGADHVLNQHEDLPLNPKDAHTATVTALYNQTLVLAITLSE